ncbi:MAG: hypothetical protein CMP25_00755 [Rickettsiales bacterium]|nr:hypothetical protein [Rickettsiales bacterium]|tara:strand:+ start:1871 stop:2404 length:534 start_codon:yes stop_codon:yes gene_type:complete
MKNIGVFCGSKNGKDIIHQNLVIEVARWIGNKKYNLVFGGGETGLMHTLCKESSKFNIKIYGIIPYYLNENLGYENFITDKILTRSLDQRMNQFLARSDFLIALPGGIGTLGEVVDLMVKKELKESKKKIYLVNDTKFWDPFANLLNSFVYEKFLNRSTLTNVVEFISLKELSKKIK